MKKITLTLAAGIAAMAISACGAEDLNGAPNVAGLALPDAKAQLQQSGFSASVKGDGLFGVLVEENWTVCEEHTPNGKLVPLDVSKDCER